jgi:hypothetical protein
MKEGDQAYFIRVWFDSEQVPVQYKQTNEFYA